MAELFIGMFSLGAFIMGIIGSILKAIMNFVIALIGFALSPITCLIEAIATVIDQIPTKDNLQEQLKDDQYELLFQEQKAENPEDTNGDMVREYSEALKGAYSNSKEDVTDMFTGIKGTIEESMNGVQGSIDNLIALKGFMECEPKRSGTNIFEKISTIAELIQIANLIKSVVTKKAGNAAHDELCKSVNPDHSTKDKVEPFSNDDIAEVIEGAFNGVARIVEGQNGEGDVAILFKENEGEDPNNLGFFTCNMKEFVKDSYMDAVIEDAVFVAEERFKTEGASPKINRRSRTSVNDPSFSYSTEERVFALGESSGSKTEDHIMNIIDTVLSFDPVQGNRVKVSDNEFIKDKLDNFKLTPDTLPEEEDISTVDEASEASVGISNNILSKPIELKCGTIENLQERLSFAEL